MERNPNNMMMLTAGLGLIAVGTGVPFALVLLGMLAMASGNMSLMLAAAGIGALLFLGLGMLGMAGQLLCLFSPLSQSTKTPLGVSLVCAGLAQFLGIKFLGLIGAIGFLLFLYGVCRELGAADLIQRFNSSAFLGLLCMLAGVASPVLGAMAGGGALLIGMLTAFLFGAFAFARYAQTIVDLAMRANRLRLGGNFSHF